MIGKAKQLKAGLEPSVASQSAAPRPAEPLNDDSLQSSHL